MFFQLIMSSVVITLFQRPVHSLNLSVGPGMFGLGQPVIYIVSGASRLKGMCAKKTSGIYRLLDIQCRRPSVPRRGKPGSVIRQYSVDSIRNGLDELL